MNKLPKDFEDILLTAAGEMRREYALPWVEDVLPPSDEYTKACQALYDARDRLCERFGIPFEDTDTEAMLNAALEIERKIGERMFLCGAAYGQKGSE